MTRPARFTQSDIKRAMSAARQAGFNSPRVILRPTGEIEIITGQQPKPANDDDGEDLV